MEDTECGAACLAMVLAKHGHHAPLAEVRQACAVSRDGAGADALLAAADQFGLKAEAYLADLAELPLLPLPAILHWEFRHFLVLETITSTKAVVMDPAVGRRVLSLDELGTSYTGVALTFAIPDGFRKRRRRHPSRERYLALARAHLPSLAQVLAASVALQVVGLVLPLGQKILVDRVIVPQQNAWLWGLGVALAGTVLAQSLLTLARSWVIQRLQVVMDLVLVRSFTRHLLHLPMRFFLYRRSGDLIQRIDSNTEVQSLFTDQSVAALLDVFLLVGYGALMVAFSLKLGVLVMALGLVRVICQWATHKANARLMSAELAASGAASAVLTESLNALETIKAAGAEGAFVRRWAGWEVASANSGLRRQLLNLNLGTLMGLLSDLGSTAVFLVAGWEVLGQRMTLGTFSAFLMLQGLFLTPLGSLLSAFGQLQYLGSHLGRLDDVMETPVEPSGTNDPGVLKGAISLEEVSYRYAGTGDHTLSGINLQVRPGDMVALVGPTGAGKSTLARLLLGMHLPDGGTVRFDGADLRQLDLSRLRRQVGVVLQESFLLNDTVRANLSFYDPDLPQERLEEAARLACIHEVVAALPLGYGTVIGENGATLSGGERQRLCLARALANRPAVLLMDEATSALDPDTEAQVHRNLTSLGCTRILIAHRLSTVREADLILVLDHGRVAQMGSFQGLLEEPGLFRALAKGTYAITI